MKTKPYFLVLPFLLMLFGFVSCSFSGQKADVSILIPEEVCQNVFASKSEVQAQEAEKIIEIKLFVNSKLEHLESFAYDGKKGVSKYFYDIPAKAEVYAEVCFIARENGKDIVLATGKSDIKTVTANKEVILSVIIKLEKESPDKPDNPNDPSEPENPSEPEPPVVDTTIYIYVCASGSDTEGDGTEEKPIKTIGGACGVIIGRGQQDSKWGIKISGTIPKAVIPETITTQNAKSITLAGANGLDANGIPVDKIDNGAQSGTVLTVNSSVPITITNLKLTGGYTGSGNNAGGISISQGSTVCLADGAVIVGNTNTSNGCGGAVHNEGTLYMYGSAIIGNKLATKPAVGSSSTSYLYNDGSYATKYADQLTANYSTLGGGVYNGNRDENSHIIAKLYMGYKPDSDGNPVKQELTGGFYANGASDGGAIYNAPNSFVYFDSGIIKYSTASGDGGGIYNGKNGTVEMTGGQIIENIGYWPGYTNESGGGVYNYHNSARFIMSGGVINKNWATSNGGAIANGGKVYIYGTAVIGNAGAISLATAESYGNKAVKGGAIYNDGQNYGGIDYNQRGELYIGYRPGDDGTTPVEAEYTGGIYQNFSTYNNDSSGGGGAICSTGKMKINGGTIAWNYANRNGGGIYSSHSNSTFCELSGGVIENNAAAGNGGAVFLVPSNESQLTLSDNIMIPAGNDNANDLYLTTSSYSHYSKITIGGSLSSNFAVRLTIPVYDSRMTLLKLADGANTTIAAECSKFNVAPEVTTYWYINETGTLTQQE